MSRGFTIIHFKNGKSEHAFHDYMNAFLKSRERNASKWDSDLGIGI